MVGNRAVVAVLAIVDSPFAAGDTDLGPIEANQVVTEVDIALYILPLLKNTLLIHTS